MAFWAVTVTIFFIILEYLEYLELGQFRMFLYHWQERRVQVCVLDGWCCHDHQWRLPTKWTVFFFSMKRKQIHTFSFVGIVQQNIASDSCSIINIWLKLNILHQFTSGASICRLSHKRFTTLQFTYSKPFKGLLKSARNTNFISCLDL